MIKKLAKAGSVDMQYLLVFQHPWTNYLSSQEAKTDGSPPFGYVRIVEDVDGHVGGVVDVVGLRLVETWLEWSEERNQDRGAVVERSKALLGEIK